MLVMGEQETDTAVRYRVCLFCHNNLSSPAVAKQHLVAFLTSLARYPDDLDIQELLSDDQVLLACQGDGGVKAAACLFNES